MTPVGLAGVGSGQAGGGLRPARDDRRLCVIGWAGLSRAADFGSATPRPDTVSGPQATIAECIKIMPDAQRTHRWLESYGDDLTPRPALDGSATADVAILGAGYMGFWTAYYLLRTDPSLRVVILERDIAGFGASGRNVRGPPRVRSLEEWLARH
jgi:hypothetical protein